MSEQTHATTKTIKMPGDHPITIERNLKRVVVSVGGMILADSRDVLIVREVGSLRRSGGHQEPLGFLPR
jgi:uncharacterized protein (DUF427 family)